MENTSKTLLIVVALILAGLIICGGMFIFNYSKSIDPAENLSAQEINNFNSIFLPYEGKNSGTVVRRLINNVIMKNDEYDVKINNQEVTNEILSDVVSNSTYYVSFNADEYGMINNIIISGTNFIATERLE